MSCIVNQPEANTKIKRLSLKVCPTVMFEHKIPTELYRGFKNMNTELRSVKCVKNVKSEKINLVITNGITNMNIDIYFIELSGFIHYMPNSYNRLDKEKFEKRMFGFLGLKVKTAIDIFYFMGNDSNRYNKFLKKIKKIDINVSNITDILGIMFGEKINIIDNDKKSNSYEEFGNKIIITDDTVPYYFEDNPNILNELIKKINQGLIDQLFKIFYCIKCDEEEDEIIEFESPKSIYEIYKLYYSDTKAFNILKKLVRKSDETDDLLLNIPRNGLPYNNYCKMGYNNYMTDPTKYKNLYLPYWNYDKYNTYFTDIILESYDKKRSENKDVIKISPEYFRPRRINLDRKIKRAIKYEIAQEQNMHKEIDKLNILRDLDEDNEEYNEDTSNMVTVYDFIENKLNF